MLFTCRAGTDWEADYSDIEKTHAFVGPHLPLPATPDRLASLPSACDRHIVASLLSAGHNSEGEDRVLDCLVLVLVLIPSVHSCRCCSPSREAVRTHLHAAFVLLRVEALSFAVADCSPDRSTDDGHSPARSSGRIQKCLLHRPPRSSLCRNPDTPALGPGNVPVPARILRCNHPRSVVAGAYVDLGAKGSGEHLVRRVGRSILVVAHRRSGPPVRMPLC